MNKSLKRFLLLFALICVFVCGTVFAVACTDGGGSGNSTITGGGEGGDGEETVTYSVTVTTESNVDLTTLKVQWMSGTTEASEKIALSADGKASAELDSGNYTVVLSGYDTAKYTAEDASVTATAPGATIVLTAKTHTVTVVVTNSTGVDIPADVKAQLYNGTQTVGSPVALTQIGAAITGVPYGSSYTVGLIGLPDYFAAVDAKPVGDESTVTFELTLATVDYNITVAVEDDEAHAIADTLTVAFYKDGTVVEGFEEVEVKDGVATASLLAGAYTVKVNGLDAAVEGAYYECDDVTVSVTEHTATVTLTKIIYTITLEELPVNIQADAIANLKVKLGSSTEVAFAENKAEINAPAENYNTVTISGVEKIDGALTAALTAENREAGLRLGSTDYYTKNGDYVVTTDAEGSKEISVTGHTPQDQPEVTELLYTFKWEVFGSGNSVAIGDTTASQNPITTVSGEISYILTNAQTVTFRLDHTPTGVHKFILKLTIKNAPAKGTILNPIAVSEIAGTYTLPKGSELKAAYFRLSSPLNDKKTYDLKSAGEGVEVYSLGYSPVENPPETLKVDVGGSLNLQSLNGSGTLYNYIYAKLSEPGTVLTFEVEVHLDPGASPAKPIVLQLDIAAEHTFPNDNSDKPVWFSFTPSEAGDYRFSNESHNENFKFTVYGGYTGEGATATGKDPVTVEESGSMHLEGSHTYYIAVDYIYWTKITVKIEEYVPTAGEKALPIEVENTGNTANEVNLLHNNGDLTYFKFVVTEEAFNDEDGITFKFNQISSMKVAFYADANYSNKIGEAGWNGNAMVTETTLNGLSADDVIYFTIGGYADSITFYINPPVVKPLRVGEEQTFTLAANDNVIAVEAEAGDYVLSYSIELSGPPVMVTFGTLQGQMIYSSGTGSFEITISANEALHINNFDMSPVEITLTLKKAAPKLSVGSPVTVNLPTDQSAVEIKIVAEVGTYRLEWTVDSGTGQYHIKVGSWDTTSIKSESAEITFTGSETLKVNNYAPMAATLTFKITALSGTVLEVGSPLELELKPDTVNYTYYFSQDIMLKDVPAGDYQFVMSNYTAADFAHHWYVKVGETYYTLATDPGATGHVTYDPDDPLVITIPEDCAIITLTSKGPNGKTWEPQYLDNGKVNPGYDPKGDSYAVNKTIKTTVTLVKAPQKFALGTPYTLEFEAGKASFEIPVDLKEGTYHIELDFSSAMWASGKTFYVEVNGTKTKLWDDYNFSYEAKDFTVPADCHSITIGCESSISEAFTVSATVTAAGGPTEYDMTVGESASVTVGEWGTQKTIYLEVGSYTMTLGGQYDEVYTSVAGEGISYTPANSDYSWLQEKTEQVTFEVTEAGVFTFTFGDANWGPGGQEITVLIEAASNIEVNEEKLALDQELVITIHEGKTLQLDFDFAASDSGYYVVTLSGSGVSNGGDYTLTVPAPYDGADPTDFTLNIGNSYTTPEDFNDGIHLQSVYEDSGNTCILLSCTALTDVTLSITITFVEDM